MEGARPARPDDVAQLTELARTAQAELAPMRGGAVYVAREARPEPLEESFAADLDDPSAVVHVGTIDGVVVGYAAGRIESLRDGTRLGVLSELFVEPGAREVGVGEAMMASVLDWFRGSGCAGVDALALPGHRITKNFFEGAGFTARLLVMHHRLGDADT
ncbi:MAG TPA: GNAT family N-acetyltransferase [Acidimicrobiales bacterium]|nr:GNAT family N-acetyltransferase [Acidimicrobiales bacterium]